MLISVTPFLTKFSKRYILKIWNIQIYVRLIIKKVIGHYVQYVENNVWCDIHKG